MDQLSFSNVSINSSFQRSARIDNKISKEFDNIDFSLVSRRSTKNDFQPVLFLKDACNKNNLFWSEFYQWGIF